MWIAAIRSEFRRYKTVADKAVEQVADADLMRSLGSEDNSLAIIMCHVAGNLRSRFTDFLTTDGEKRWRERDREFESRELSRRELNETWEDGWATLLGALDSLRPDDLERQVVIRGRPLTVPQALERSLAHVAYHVGQIVFLARHWVGGEWRSPSIAKGGSAAYNSNPTRELSPD